MTTTYTIEQMASSSGLSAHTLRYYEQIGLIDPIVRGSNGHRRYCDDDRRWIAFLLRLRATGMPIQHMLRYAQLRRDGEVSVSERKAMLIEHTQALAQQVASLQDNLALLQQKIELYSQIELAMGCTPTVECTDEPDLPTRQPPLSPS